MVSGSFENAKLLLSRGADANGRDNSGRTALWYTAISENTGFITLLLEHGSDVNARDEAGRTALMNAADICYTWDVRALLDGGADPTLVDKRGRTALEPQLFALRSGQALVLRGDQATRAAPDHAGLRDESLAGTVGLAENEQEAG